MTGYLNLGSISSGLPTGQDALTTTVTLMAKIGVCLSPSFSPDGKQIALISTLNGIPQVWVVSTAGGWPELVTSLDDQIYQVFWSPDGRWLAFSLAPGGGMNEQIYLIRPDGRGLRRLTDGGKENNRLIGWTPDGQKLLMGSNRRRADAVDAYLIDVESGQLQLVTKNPGVGTFTDVSQDGRYAVLYRLVNRGDNDLFLINLENGDEILLTPHEGPGTFEGGRFAPDGRTIYLSSNQDRELIAFCRIEIDEGDGRKIPGPIEVLVARDDAELITFDITRDGTTAALLWNVAGYVELDFIDLATGEQSPGPKLPTEIAFSPTFSQDGNLLALVLSGAAAPMNVFVFDRQADRLWQVTRSSHPGVALDKMTRPKLVRFPAYDKLELSGWLYQPDNFTSPGPVVLSFHGGPEDQERPFFNGTYQALLTQGIAVFAPNVRGSSGFGKTFVNLDNGPLRFNAIYDIKSCVDYVVSSGLADPQRIGIMGGSYGGYMTMAGLTEYPDLFAAGANLFGIVNFETFFEHTESWMAEISKIEYGDPQTQAELLRDLSPIHKLDRVVAATLVLHGANDTNVPVIEAEQIVEQLKKRDIPVKYVLFTDEGHGFSKDPNRVRSTVEIVQWFVEHLSI